MVLQYFHVELHSIVMVCGLLIPFTAPRGDGQASPLTDLIWFCHMCSLIPPRPGQLLISPLLLFITFESGNKTWRMWGTNVTIKRGGVGGVACERTKSSLLQWSVWERRFYHPRHLSVWLQIWCNFLSLSHPVPLVLYHLVSSVSFPCCCLFCQIPG